MASPLPAARRAPDLLRRLLGAAWALLGALGEALLSLLAPACCAACDEPLGPRVLFCPVCASSLVPLDPPAERGATESPPGGLAIVAYGGYGGALAEALQRFKYRARPDLARALGELARRAAEQAGLAAECVVPVPLHPRRLGERGYNQAALVARAVAPALGGRLLPCALGRTRPTRPQAGLDRAARRDNVMGAFVVSQPARIRGRAVVLVDDVATTGATLEACARALRDAGAREVCAVVVARAGMAS